jgi:hypothetical protein
MVTDTGQQACRVSNVILPGLSWGGLLQLTFSTICADGSGTVAALALLDLRVNVN